MVDAERLSRLLARVRAAQHVISSEGLGMPQTNADALRLWGKNGVIESELAEGISCAVGFGNVLVHEYAEADDSVVVANLGLLPDLDAFMGQLAGWAVQT